MTSTAAATAFSPRTLGAASTSPTATSHSPNTTAMRAASGPTTRRCACLMVERTDSSHTTSRMASREVRPGRRQRRPPRPPSREANGSPRWAIPGWSVSAFERGPQLLPLEFRPEPLFDVVHHQSGQVTDLVSGQRLSPVDPMPCLDTLTATCGRGVLGEIDNVTREGRLHAVTRQFCSWSAEVLAQSADSVLAQSVKTLPLRMVEGPGV